MDESGHIRDKEPVLFKIHHPFSRLGGIVGDIVLR